MIAPQKLPGGSIGRELQKNLMPGEQVLAYAQGKANQLLLATDQRVIIIKGAVGSGGLFFGTTTTAFFYPQLSGVQVRKNLGDGFVEVSASGMQNVQRNRVGQMEAPNIVPFNAWDEKRFQEVAMVIRQRMQQMFAAQMGTPPVSTPTPTAYIQSPMTVPATPVMLPKPCYRYQLWELGLVIGLFILSGILSIAFGSSDTNSAASDSAATSPGVTVGTIFFLISLGYACFRDWSGVISLRQMIRWETMSARGRVWSGIGLICFFPIAYIVYLWRATSDFFQQRKADKAERPYKIAQMEAKLGIMPATDGTCRACGKALHAGAEFCAFCGESVVEQPRICPNCAATALPDARYCPRCRTDLPQ